MLVIGFTACRKEFTSVECPQAQPSPSTQRIAGPDAAIYVNDFSTILGSINKEDSFTELVSGAEFYAGQPV